MSVEIKNLLGSVYTVNSMPTGGSKALKYTTIGRLLYWINESFMLKDGDGKVVHEFYVGKHDYKCKPQDNRKGYKIETPFLTFEHHFCTAVERFILPKLGDNRTNPFFIKYASDDTIRELIFGDGSDILDILINLHYIQSKFESNIAGVEETSINIYDLVKEILEDLNNDLGYINEFDIHLKDSNTYYVIDRKVTPGFKDLENTIIDLVGLGSTATNINLTSNLTNETAMFSVISAATLKSDVPVENSAMMSWNKGLQDRFIKEKFVNSNPDGRLKALEDKVIALQGYCYYINKDLQRLPEIAAVSLESSHKAVMTELVAEKSYLAKVSPPGIIPVQLSFEILGISGINVGQSFILEKGILPTSYEGRAGFIVGGVSHKVADNRWSTEIVGYMVMIDNAIRLTKEGRPTIIDILSGDKVALEVEKLNKESKEIAAIKSAEVDENTDDRTFFNELAKKAVEQTKDEFTPKWEGFRASLDVEGQSGSKLIRYYNQTKSRKGILHPDLIYVINAATDAANKAIDNDNAYSIKTISVESGGQISMATLNKYGVTNSESINRVRHSNKHATINHDNGYAADITLNGKGVDPKTIGTGGDKNKTVTLQFIKSFFEIAASRGYVPRIGVGYMNHQLIHVGFFKKQTIRGGTAANIFGGKKGDEPNFDNLKNLAYGKELQDFYIKMYGENKTSGGFANNFTSNNKSIIARGSAT